MFMVYLVFILASLSTAKGIIQAIQKKERKELWASILSFPFFFGMFVGILSGGSALHNAAKDYNLYQAGHYYLMDHGIWTEVSYEKYLFVLVSEIIGISSLVLSFIFALLRNRRQKV